MIFRCAIETRAIPWKSPRIGKHGPYPLHKQPSDYQAWARWGAGIRTLLAWAYRQNNPVMSVLAPDAVFDGLTLDLDLLFVMAPGGTPPDRMNLGKSFEDLIQGVIFRNDRCVQGGDVRRVFIGRPRPGGGVWEGPERVHLRVTAPA